MNLNHFEVAIFEQKGFYSFLVGHLPVEFRGGWDKILFHWDFYSEWGENSSHAFFLSIKVV